MMGSILRRYRGRRQLLHLFIALLLGLGVLAGCGGDDGDSDTSAATTAAETESETEAEDSTSPAKSGAGKSKGEESKGEGQKRSGGDDAESADEAAGGEEFVVPPNRHKDSGGGSKQFRTKGGDNSIQDYGKETTGSEFEEVAAIVHAFLDARAAGNSKESCKYLAGAIVDQLLQLAEQAPDAPKDCAGILDALTAPLTPEIRRSISTADIASFRAEGDSGFVLYRGVEKQLFVMPMARENGQWKVAAIAGSPMP